MPISEELILGREAAKELSDSLNRMLNISAYYQIKIRITDDKIVLIPHASAVEITRK